MRKARKHYTAEEKVAILRRHLVDKEPVSKLCDELAPRPTVFYRWQKEFFENGARAQLGCGARLPQLFLRAGLRDPLRDDPAAHCAHPRKNFLPAGLRRFQRRVEEVALLIREAFPRGISSRQLGRVVATLTGEVVSAQTVSKLTRDLDRAVEKFHQARLRDEWVYWFLDGVSLRVRRPAGRQRVRMLVAYGARADGSRQLLGFLRSRGESQAAWEGLLQDLYRRGLQGRSLALIVTDGCPGLAAAIETVYPRALHQRCWGHKMRNILESACPAAGRHEKWWWFGGRCRRRSWCHTCKGGRRGGCKTSWES